MAKKIVEQRSNEVYAPIEAPEKIHCGDIVEPTGTGRRAKIASGPKPPLSESRKKGSAWGVEFLDGNRPAAGNFQTADLLLIKCPHSESGPGFDPDRGII